MSPPVRRAGESGSDEPDHRAARENGERSGIADDLTPSPSAGRETHHDLSPEAEGLDTPMTPDRCP